MIYQRGEHDIEYQLTYPGSNFIFHDSRGIEAGSKGELEMVKNFIQTRGQNAELKNQLHVIWWVHSFIIDWHCYLSANRYCIPMDDHRPISAVEEEFFKLGTGGGNFFVCCFLCPFYIFSIFLVPVVVIFTKFDALVIKSYSNLRDQQKNHEEAKSAMHELANKTFQDHYLSPILATEVPPKAHICLAGNLLYFDQFL